MTYALTPPPVAPTTTTTLTAQHALMHTQEQAAITDLDLRVTARELNRYVWGATKVANYSLALADRGTILGGNHATGLTFTITKHATAAWLPGDSFIGRQGLAGPITFTPDAGVTLNPPPGVPVGGALLSLGQFAWVEFTYVGSDVWDVIGMVQVRESAQLWFPVTALGSNLTAGEGKGFYWRVPSQYNGYSIVGVAGGLDIASSSLLPSIGVRRKRAGSDVEVLSVNLTFNVSATDSIGATTPPTINTSNSGLQTGDKIYFDIDTAGTGAQGLGVELTLN